MRPRLLDLFCGGGGTSVGYHRAGFEVVGVDIEPMARYPFEFHQADAMTYPLEGFDALAGSPPCQDHSISQNMTGKLHGTGWMLAATRERFIASGLPWVIENVPGAPMRADYVLCGCMVGLPRLKRERWFETSWGGFSLRSPCQHDEPSIPIAGHGVTSYYRRRYGSVHIADRREAMGIDWEMDRDQLAQAIPPAYTELIIGPALLEHLGIGGGSMRVDDFLDQVLSEPASTAPPCPCSHPREFHRHGDDGRHCIRACGCRRFRGVAEPDETSAATGTEGAALWISAAAAAASRTGTRITGPVSAAAR